MLVLVGNHEYYSREKTPASTLLLEAQQLCKQVSDELNTPDKVILLENRSVMLEGVRVCGTALWSAVHRTHTLAGWEEAPVETRPAVHRTVFYGLSDYRYIYNDDGTPTTPEVTTEWHNQAVSFLKQEAAAATAASESLLVLSHHSPSFNAGTAAEHQDEARPDG